MRAVTLLVLLSFSAFAAEPAPVDAPRIVVMAPGDVAPAPGLFLPESIALAQAKEKASDKAQLKVYRDGQLSTGATIGIISGVVAAVVAAAVIGYEVGKKAPR